MGGKGGYCAKQMKPYLSISYIIGGDLFL